MAALLRCLAVVCGIALLAGAVPNAPLSGLALVTSPVASAFPQALATPAVTPAHQPAPVFLPADATYGPDPPRPTMTRFECPGILPKRCYEDWRDRHPNHDAAPECAPEALIEYCKWMPSEMYTIPIMTSTVAAQSSLPTCRVSSPPECQYKTNRHGHKTFQAFNAKWKHGGKASVPLHFDREPEWCKNELLYQQICYLWDEPQMADLLEKPLFADDDVLHSTFRTPAGNYSGYLDFPLDSCAVSYKTFKDNFFVFGANWDEEKLGPNGTHLKNHIQSDCSAVTAWRFVKIRKQNDAWPWQFFATGSTIIGQHECVGKAMQKAGAPQGHCPYTNGEDAATLVGLALGALTVFIDPFAMPAAVWSAMGLAIESVTEALAIAFSTEDAVLAIDGLTDLGLVMDGVADGEMTAVGTSAEARAAQAALPKDESAIMMAPKPEPQPVDAPAAPQDAAPPTQLVNPTVQGAVPDAVQIAAEKARGKSTVPDPVGGPDWEPAASPRKPVEPVSEDAADRPEVSLWQPENPSGDGAGSGTNADPANVGSVDTATVQPQEAGSSDPVGTGDRASDGENVKAVAPADTVASQPQGAGSSDQVSTGDGASEGENVGDVASKPADHDDSIPPPPPPPLPYYWKHPLDENGKLPSGLKSSIKGWKQPEEVENVDPWIREEDGASSAYKEPPPSPAEWTGDDYFKDPDSAHLPAPKGDPGQWKYRKIWQADLAHARGIVEHDQNLKIAQLERKHPAFVDDVPDEWHADQTHWWDISTEDRFGLWTPTGVQDNHQAIRLLQAAKSRQYREIATIPHNGRTRIHYYDRKYTYKPGPVNNAVDEVFWRKSSPKVAFDDNVRVHEIPLFTEWDKFQDKYRAWHESWVSCNFDAYGTRSIMGLSLIIPTVVPFEVLKHQRHHNPHEYWVPGP